MIIDIYKLSLILFGMAFKRDFNQEMDDEKMSKINSAGIINITLENLWRDCYSALKLSKLSQANRILDGVWMILGGDVAEGSEKEKAFLQIDKEIYETGSLDHKNVGFDVDAQPDNEIKAKQYLLLRKKALFLRRLQNNQGKGTAYDTGDDDDWD